MGYLATEIIVLLAGAAVIGLIIGWPLFGLGKNKAATTTTVAVRDEKTDNELKSERDSRKKAEVRILELEARETNFGERLQERDTKIAELMHQLDEQACGSTKDCKPVLCRQGCSNVETFTSCAFKDVPTICPPQACDCGALGEEACLRVDRFCAPHYCPSCGGADTFNGCYLVSQVPPACPSLCPRCRTKPQCENQGCAAILNPAPEPNCPCDMQHPGWRPRSRRGHCRER